MKAHGSWLLVLGVGLAACGELAAPRDVMGNFEAEYEDNLRIYIGDELVADVVSGEDATFEWDGESFQVSQVCSDEGVECPGETFWRSVAIDQPWGNTNKLLNFVNLDTERGEGGERLGGTMQDDGSFEMLSGLALTGNANCVALGVGTVVGSFSAANDALTDGIIVYEWSAGCSIGGIDIGASLRVETDYRATRSGEYDVSSVEPEAPVDDAGEEVEPTA